jgi:DNA invertase Pin-like site-specific DNA recombinase
MVDVVCYYRHSTDNAKQDKNSIERQQKECLRHCKHKGWNVILEVKDKAISGASDKDNLMKLKKSVELGEIKFDILVVDDQSRITRKSVLEMMQDIGFLADAGIHLSFVATNYGDPSSIQDLGRDHKFIFEGMSNHEEVRKTARKVVTGMLSLHEEKQLSWVGKPPTGYDRIVPYDPALPMEKQPRRYLVGNDDLKIVRQIFLNILAGKSYNSCVPLLEKAERYKKEGAGDPSSTSVKHILHNSIYCGYWSFGVRNVGQYEVVNPAGKKNANDIPNLDHAASIWEDYVDEVAVSLAEYREVQNIMKRRKEKGAGAPVSAGHRYSGILRCGQCGGSVVAHPRRKRENGVRFQTKVIDYVCAHSSKTGRKCRPVGGEPFRKAFVESELDEMLADFFGECISLNNSFHASVIKNIVSGIQYDLVIGDDDLLNRRNEISKREEKLRQAYQRFDDLPDFVVVEANEIKRIKDQLESDAERKVNLSDIAKQHYDEWVAEGMEERKVYLAAAWEVASEILEGYLDVDDADKFASRIMKMIQEVFFSVGSNWRYLADEDDDIVGVTFKNPDDLLLMLKDVGLETIQCNWKLGKRRGKPKQLLDNISLSLIIRDLVTTNDHILTCAVDCSNENGQVELTTL